MAATMNNMMRTVWLAAVLLLSMIPLTGRAAEAGYPMPRIVVPKLGQVPVIDGRMAPGEWDAAAALTGFVSLDKPSLVHIQTVVWFGYDEKYFYVCFKNNRGPETTLLSRSARDPDNGAIVFEQANEVLITPPINPPTTFQSLINTYPAVYDKKAIPQIGYASLAWNGGWEVASSETNDYWIIEGRAPIKNFAATAPKNGDVWKGLFTRDLGDADGFRAWAPGSSFIETTRHGTFEFREGLPVFQLLDVESVFTGQPKLAMAVNGPAQGTTKVIVTARFGTNMTASAGDLVLTKELTVAAGKREAFELAGAVEAGLSTVTVETRENPLKWGSPRVKKDVREGWCEITAKTDKGDVLSSQCFAIQVDGVVRTPPAAIDPTPYKTEPFGIRSLFAPLARKLVVKADRYYMPARDSVAGGTVKLVDPVKTQVVAQAALYAPYLDYASAVLDLKDLKLPVETEADWEAAEKVRKLNAMIVADNVKRKAAGQPELPTSVVPVFTAATYRVEVTLTDKEGKPVASTSKDVELKGYEFKWLGNTLGMSDKVIPPWTPLQWDGRTLSMWNKSYRLNALGLAESVINSGAAQLSGMQLVATVDGKATPVSAGTPVMRRLTEAAADLEGQAAAGDLQVAVATRVEFDGFVLNRMTITPRKPVKLDHLALVVTMPTNEGPLMVSTSGGDSYTGWTPDRWDSRAMAAGGRHGNFVPYVMLTDSDRGFTWFADNDPGWIVDPDKPAIELVREGGQLRLQVNFVNRPGVLDKPTTITYGWMITPQKPQPAGFRAWTVQHYRTHPKGGSVFYGEADWAVLSPYYCSPFPWDYDKSKDLLDASRSKGTHYMIGHILHSIGRFQDYRGRQFPELINEWGCDVGDASWMASVARSRGPTDFQIWHFDRWIGHSGLPGLYFDECYQVDDRNFLTGGAYLRDNGSVQPGYHYLAQREYVKRMRYLFNDHGKSQPNLFFHTTGQQPVYSWLCDVSMEGENVYPRADLDYPDVLPECRLRTIGMGRNLGTIPTIMLQSYSSGWTPENGAWLSAQGTGWMLAHDTLPNGGSPFWNETLMPEMEMWREDMRFLPYWKPGLGVEPRTPDARVSAHVVPRRAVLWVFNTARQDQVVQVALDLKKLGLSSKGLRAFDAETGEAVAFDGRAISVPVPRRMWRAVRLVNSDRLKGDMTFTASFDKGETSADEALGDAYSTQLQNACAPGRAGFGVWMDQPLVFHTRHHVTRESGAVAFALRPAAANGGTLLTLGNGTNQVVITWKTNGMDVTQVLKRDAAAEKVAAGSLPAPDAAGWIAVRVKWEGHKLTVEANSQPVVSADLPGPVAIRPMDSRGLQINESWHGQASVSSLVLGPFPGAILDDLVMSQALESGARK